MSQLIQNYFPNVKIGEIDQSWHPLPTHMLPENRNDTQTYAVKYAMCMVPPNR
jgi:hypothetical protein